LFPTPPGPYCFAPCSATDCAQPGTVGKRRDKNQVPRIRDKTGCRRRGDPDHPSPQRTLIRDPAMSELQLQRGADTGLIAAVMK
jgi:hypothetical protein